MVDKIDNGVIGFGRFKGQKWSDVNRHYLEYLITPECLTREENKIIAKQELSQRDVCEGQTIFLDADDEQ